MDALTYMDLPNTSDVEFKRKVRISTGNFQNLQLFWTMLFRFNGVAFAFWSHKVLRWSSPFFLLTALFSSAVLAINSSFFAALAGIQLLLMALPVFNRMFPFKNELLKFISHFYLMNLALLAGFLQFTKGISSSVWQPVKRDV